MSGVYRGRKEIEAVADNAAPNATILHHRSSMWYMVLVEKRRRDLTIVDPFFHNKEVAYADIVWPDDIDLATTDRRYGTDDLSGVSTAKKGRERRSCLRPRPGGHEPRALPESRLRGGPCKSGPPLRTGAARQRALRAKRRLATPLVVRFLPAARSRRRDIPQRSTA